MSDLARRRFSVGYALAQKKVHSFIQPSLVDHARERGVDLIPLDPSKPLVDQGSFDCIIHKLYDQEWKKNLIDFSSKYPNVPVIDHPDAIERLRNRITMLQVVDELQLPSHDRRLSIPKQIVIYDSKLASDPNTITLQGLTFPIIAKPLVADGSATSHEMSLVFNSDGLKKLKPNPPVVLQEFVNHGGVIYKVYVVGEYVQCVKRRSLPDVSAKTMGNSEGLLSFSQISNLVREDQDDCDHTSHIEEAKMPPWSFINDIAKSLRQATTLHLFNFDMIRDRSTANRHLIIDINYFPGYAKMPSYESVLTDFFLGVVQKKQSEGRCLEPKERQGSGSEDDKQERLV